MKNYILSLTLVLVILFSCTTKDEFPKPPLAPKQPAVDEYFGQKIEDPYRNLENLEDSTVIHWLKAQKTYAEENLNKIPERKSLMDKIISLNRKEEYSFGFILNTVDGKYFYTKANTDDYLYKVYYRENLDSEEVLLFDPKEYSEEELYINFIRPSWSGDKIAISLNKTGEEISKIIVIEVKDRALLSGVINNSLTTVGGITWISDDTGFIYLYSPITDPTDEKFYMNTKSIFYRVGSNPKNMIDVFSSDNNSKLNPEDIPIIANYDSQDGYLFAMAAGSSSFYDTYVKKEADLLDVNKKWIPLFSKEDKVKQVRFSNNDIIFLSAKNAPNFQLCKTSTIALNFDNPEIIVPEKENEIITKFINNEKGIYFSTQKNGVESNFYHITENGEEEIVLPKPMGEMNIQSLSFDQDYIKISARGYLTPITHYLFDLKSETFKLESLVPNLEFPEFENLIVEHKEIPSHDGVLVPISIIRHNDLKKNENTPTFFFGYGAYGAPGSTSFNPPFLTWVSEGGILVYAHVRGGGEKGETWHKAGYKTTKPNTWKDMIAITEYMINEGYTNPNKTALWGSSAGGILAGRAMTERPDLYKAVILTSPALNMLRSEIQPNGQNSIKEFGTVKNKEEFEALLEMDAYHHIENGKNYPATLVTGGMKDGRVVIWDPAKFVARLQQIDKSEETKVLFKVDFDQGHGTRGSSHTDYYKMYVDAFAFALWQTGHPDYQPE